MTTHIDQLKSVLEYYTSYLGGVYPTYLSLETVPQALSKFYLVPKSVRPRINNMNSEVFHLFIESDSQANLETMKNTFLKLSSNSSTPYTPPPTSITITGSIKTSIDDLEQYNSTDGGGTLTNLDEDHSFIVYRAIGGGAIHLDRSIGMIFTLDDSLPRGYSLTSAILTVTPEYNAGYSATIETVGCLQDTPDLSSTVWTNTILTKTLPTTTTVIQTVYSGSNWIKDAAISINIKSIFEELIARSGWDESKIGIMMHSLTETTNVESHRLYLDDPTHASGTKIPTLSIVYTGLSETPYYLDIQPTSGIYWDNNQFKMELEIEARWVL